MIKDSIVELKETELWQYLNEIDSDYANNAIIFVTHVTPLLKSIREYFPYYTRHDAHHGFRVLKRMGQVIDKKCLSQNESLGFTSIEAFLLICSAYAHDLGMTVFPDEEDALIAKLKIKKDGTWKNDATLQRFLRENHSVRGGAYIDEHHIETGVAKNLISHLNLLMSAHNLSINEFQKQLGRRVAAGERELDLKQLACILCVADALEFSENRVVEGVLESLEQKIQKQEDEDALISYKENMKHVCIGDNLAIGKDGKIIVSGTFNEPEILNLAHKTIDFIELWIRNYTDIDFESQLKRLIIRSDSIERTFDILGYNFERLGIRIRKEHIINLISSNSTWSGNTAVVLRELLQNSVEACRYRQFNSSPASNYQPEIKILANKDERTIVITDNGCGMSRTTILNNFLTVGNSRSLDTTYKTSEFNSLARFGIGFWSTFTIAKTATIETAPFENFNQTHDFGGNVKGMMFDVSVDEFKDYTLFKNIEMLPGTRIKILLKDNISVDDLLQRLNGLLLCSEIPIEINYDGELFNIPLQPKLKSFKELAGTKNQLAINHGVKEFIFEKKYDDLDFKLKLFYRIENNLATFRLGDNHSSIGSVLDLVMSIGGKLSICGFATNFQTKSLIFDFNRVGTMVCNTNDPSGYVFDLNRLFLLPSKSSIKTMEVINDAIHEAYLKLINDTNSFNNKTIYNLNQESRLNGGNVYSQYSNSFLFDLYSKFPQLLCFKLLKIERNKTLMNSVVKYQTFDEIKANEIELWAFTTYIVNYSNQIRIDPEKDSHQIFNILCNSNLINGESYYLEPSNDVSLLFDNDSNSCVTIIDIPNQNVRLPLLKIFSKSMNAYEKHDWHICSIQGVWTGTILEKEVYGANFVFLKHYKLIVKPNTAIASKVRELFVNDQVMKLCNLVKLLLESSQGYVDKTIETYL